MKTGSLYIVGTGIKALGHVTLEIKGFISQADKVFYVTADKITEKWIKKLNVNAESLLGFYQKDKLRFQAHQETIDKILDSVRQGLKVCAVFYGHPGVCVYPSYKTIELARQEGHHTVMMAGISVEDCLYADLGINPALYGCQRFEATDFLIYRRKIDSHVPLILWQVGVVGCLTYEVSESEIGLSVLTYRLLEDYPSSHEIIIYEANQYSFCTPMIQRLPLKTLPKEKINFNSTLYIPPHGQMIPDLEMLTQLSIRSCDSALLSEKCSLDTEISI